MRRRLYPRLVEWKNDPRRKPLLLYGARQVGKTYLLKEFGKAEFDNMVYLNCYKNEPLKILFEEDTNVRRILTGLSAIAEQEITPERTLIILDEVQDIPEAVAALKYFCEDAPEICIAAAGSLLGVLNMEGNPFPTGKVNILHLYPMDFIEFLWGIDETKKAELLCRPEAKEEVNLILDGYKDLLRQYYFVGGMPEAVVEFKTSRTPNKVRSIQLEILEGYNADIAKHAGNETQRARMVFESIPAQLSKENKKFIFGALKKGARGSQFELAIQWLVDAGLVYKVDNLSKVGIPLKFYYETDAFKLYFLDTGLLGALGEVPASQMLIGDNVFSEFKGAFTENYVLTQLKPIENLAIGYYSKPSSRMEIDFIVQADDKLLPIEVKAEENVKAKSLRQFVVIDHAGELHGYRFSIKGYREQDWMTNVPLPAVSPFVRSLSQELKV